MAITVVQSKDATGTGTAVSLALTTAVTAGNLLIVGIEFGFGNNFGAGPSGNGNVYNKRFNFSGTNNNFGQVTFFDVPSAAAGLTTITATLQASSFWDIFAYEVNTTTGQWFFDPNVNYQGGNGTALTSGSMNNISTNEILLGFGTVANAVTAGTAGWTFVITAGGDGRETLIVSARGSNVATFTQSVSGFWLAGIAGWYAASAPILPPQSGPTPWIEYIGVGRVI